MKEESLQQWREKAYRMKNLGMKAIVGRKVTAAWISAEKDLVVLDTDKGRLYLCWNGDCCARCYLAHAEGVDALVGGTVGEVENAEWKDLNRNEDDYEVVESMGTKIRTDKGWVTLESRVEHNGYYGGAIDVSDDEPMDQYSSPRRYGPNGALPELVPLKDF